LVYISSNNPSPIISRKIDYLYSQNLFNIHLIYWKRLNSSISFPFTSALSKNNIHPIVLPESQSMVFRVYYMIRFGFYVFKKCLKLKPHIVQSINMDMLLLGYVIARILKIKILILDLLDTREVFLNPYFKFLYKNIVKKLSWVFVTSPKFIDEYILLINSSIQLKKISYIPNVPHSNIVDNFKKKSDSNLCIGYFGFFRGTNSLRNLIESVKELYYREYNISCFFAGIGIETAYIEKISKKYSFIKYFGKYDYNNEIKRLYQNVDIIYSVYDIDYNKKLALGCRFNESILFGLPLIVQKNTYMGELVKRYDNGFVLRQNTKQDLFNLLANIMKNKTLLAHKSLNSKKLFNQFIFETYIPVLNQAYHSMLS
ncbi:glycosyltransferase, partial [candidate division KSB1 bacterium]|nr:glycosyltransferase [candidate division KSB1 bacterium]